VGTRLLATAVSVADRLHVLCNLFSNKEGEALEEEQEKGGRKNGQQEQTSTAPNTVVAYGEACFLCRSAHTLDLFVFK
jgi:hypothetical protein